MNFFKKTAKKSKKTIDKRCKKLYNVSYLIPERINNERFVNRMTETVCKHSF